MTGSFKTLAAVVPGGATSNPAPDTQDTRALIRTLDRDDPWLGNLLLAKLFILVNKVYEDEKQKASQSNNVLGERLASQGFGEIITYPDIASIFRKGYFEIKYKNENELKDFFFKLIENVGVSKKLFRNKFVLNVPWGGYGCENTEPVQLIFEFEHDHEDNDISIKMYFSDRTIIKDEQPIELNLTKGDVDHLNKTYHPKQLKQRAIVAAISGDETFPEMEVEIIPDAGKRTPSTKYTKLSTENTATENTKTKANNLFYQHQELRKKAIDQPKSKLIASTIFYKANDTEAKYYPYENVLSYGYSGNTRIEDPALWYRLNRWRQYHGLEFLYALIFTISVSFFAWVLTGGLQFGLLKNQHLVDMGTIYSALTMVGSALLSAAAMVYYYWGKENYYQRDEVWVPFKKTWQAFLWHFNQAEHGGYKFFILLSNVVMASFFMMPLLTLGIPLLLTNLSIISLPYVSKLAEMSQVAMLLVSLITIALFQWGRKFWLNHLLEVDVVRDVQLSPNEQQNSHMLKLSAYEQDRSFYITEQRFERDSGVVVNSQMQKGMGTKGPAVNEEEAPGFTLGFDPALTAKHVDNARVGVLNCALVLHDEQRTSPQNQKITDGPIADSLGGGRLNTLLWHDKRVKEEQSISGESLKKKR